MIYTLQYGVQQTWGDKMTRVLRYGMATIGFGTVLLFVGNVWYAARYNPAPRTGGTQQIAGTPIDLTTVSMSSPDTDTASTPSTNSAWQPAVVQRAHASASDGTSVTNATADAPATVVETSPDVTTGGMGGGSSVITPTPPVDDVPIVTDPPVTTPVDTGGDTPVVTIPPIVVTVPVIEIPVTTPDVGLGL